MAGEKRDELTLAALSMTTTADKAANIQAAVRLVEEAASHGVDWIQLPEMFPFMGGYDRVFDMAEEEGGQLFETMRALARKHRVVLFAGTVGERPGP